MKFKIHAQSFKHIRLIFAINTILCFIFIATIGCCTWDHPETFSESLTPHDEFSPLSGMIRFYQGPMNHLSAVRFGECPMHPHCSEYALEAIEKHGMILGWFMTCDRLMRCGRDETDISPEILVDGKWKTLDPIDCNDPWLNSHLLYP
jgi:putative component of membrane protein insertase Oxa1/YidC/SpoIIIJ protein YidD